MTLLPAWMLGAVAGLVSIVAIVVLRRMEAALYLKDLTRRGHWYCFTNGFKLLRSGSLMHRAVHLPLALVFLLGSICCSMLTAIIAFVFLLE